jgi:hypothetical protein
MLRSFGWGAVRMSLVAGMVSGAATGLSRAAETDPDIGVVLASSGRPMIQDTSGRTGPSAAMQPIREDDVILFNAGESVTICNEVLGSTFEIAGPGTVRLTRSGVVSVTGSPGVRNAGPCEASAPGNTNGGVLLRRFSRATPR